MEVKKPRIEIGDVLGAASVLLGFIFLLIGIHLMAIRSTGDTSAVLGTVFSVSLMIFIGLLILSLVTVIILLLQWLVWSIRTPEWKKREGD